MTPNVRRKKKLQEEGRGSRRRVVPRFRAWGEDQGKVLGAIAKTYDDLCKKVNEGKI